MEIPKQIKDEIWGFCQANDITDVEGFTQKMLKQGFTMEKYGAGPASKVVEVEVVKEVPVEKIVIKEVIKEVKIANDTKESELLLEVDGLKTQLGNEKNRVLELETMNKKCEEELEAEKKIEKKREDIYGESGGKFGSNILDMFKNKKNE